MGKSGLTLQSLNDNILGIKEDLVALRAKREESKKWQIVIVLSAPIATAVLGCFVWFWQSGLQHHIDDQAHELTSRLALSEEFYRRKLAVYEKIHQQTVDLVNALNDVGLNPTSQKAAAIDSIHALYMNYSSSTLYVSSQLRSDLEKLVDSSGHLHPLDLNGKVSMDMVENELKSIEDQMKIDLHLDEIGQFPTLKTSN
jgi:hypothetical protein